MKSIAILISGEGSNLQNIIEYCKNGKINARIVVVISDRDNIYGLIRSRAANIETKIISPKNFSNRKEYDLALTLLVKNYNPDVIVLAGYMRILSTYFVNYFSGKILNIHPSLLPLYPGLHTYRKVLYNGDVEHGTSVHFVTDLLDNGPIILQEKVPIVIGDNEKKLKHKIKIKEYIIYPLVINWFLQGRLSMYNNVAWLDGKPLPSKGYKLR